ncbi:uncharacterized protein ARMOST_21363 [Armillaria ostoyae]|uniref:Uncharacterized protein n=1 Tax=Armillaria ostoyae TaxID=47428 RepID=A0A284S9W8_ARMOS|nr:uncharacterized protein ARMOST_21363 [Armillaria ostoyae]
MMQSRTFPGPFEAAPARDCKKCHGEQYGSFSYCKLSNSTTWHYCNKTVLRLSINPPWTERAERYRIDTIPYAMVTVLLDDIQLIA